MLYGVRTQAGDNFVITAFSEQEATDMLNDMGYADFEVVDAEDLVNDQYNGLAILGTV